MRLNVKSNVRSRNLHCIYRHLTESPWPFVCHHLHSCPGGGCLLHIGVQGLKAVMGRTESRRVVRLAADNLDVARCITLGGPDQRGVEFTKRSDFCREPTLAAQGGGKSMIVPGGEVVVDPIRIRLERPLDHVALVVEDKNDWLKSVASHGPDGGRRQLVRTFPCDEDGSSRRIGQGSSKRRPCGPTDRAPQRCRLHFRAVGKGEREGP